MRNMASQKDKTHKYAVVISWSSDAGDLVFVADVPELPGCTAHGDTHEEALANAQEAIALWLDTCDELDLPRPAPGIISQIMRSEYVNIEKQGIAKTGPGILRAQIDFLCQESRQEYNAAVQSKYD